MDYKAQLHLAIDAAIKAGAEIMKIYTTDFYVETKSDNTPVTAADKASGEIITQLLSASGMPVISEEETLEDYTVRKSWTHAWLVDPLDGTKEFVKRNGEFAVNIALTEYGRPVIGVIYAPVLNCIYFAAAGLGSYKITDATTVLNKDAGTNNKNIFEPATKMPSQKLPKDYTVVASRSHLSREINVHINKLKNLYGTVDVINTGSSIKQCWVADGLAHEYPRFGTTMEWDTAAGQCILEQAGGALVDYASGLPLLYNKESMYNGYFIAKTLR